jgi:hypothetical protein
MKDVKNQNQFLVSMPNCSNILFEFSNGNIVKSKRIADKNAKNAISYYKLTSDFQNAIIKFLNPKAF